MRIDLSPGLVQLRLSRRNINALLRMLDERDKVMPALSGRDKHVEILVLAQEDEEHYTDYAAGSMSWEDKKCMCDGGGGVTHAPGPLCTSGPFLEAFR